MTTLHGSAANTNSSSASTRLASIQPGFSRREDSRRLALITSDRWRPGCRALPAADLQQPATSLATWTALLTANNLPKPGYFATGVFTDRIDGRSVQI